MLKAANNINFAFILIALVLANCKEVEEELVVRVLGGPAQVKLLANEMGYYYKGPVKGFRNTYLLVPIEGPFSLQKKRNGNRNKIQLSSKVLWAETQKYKQRLKRDFLFFKKRTRNVDKLFNDELWNQEWYLQDTRTRPDLPKLDLNVLPLYQMGVTGKGVRITILDDGIEYTHDDLRDNYDPEISWDCNDDDADPIPHYDTEKESSHGTRCAGEVAMTANNGKCGVGVAFQSNIGGVKLLGGPVNDRIEGTALSHARNKVDIYSASWGPSDDGRTVDGPGRLAKEALLMGIKHGRNGKGSIYVWASGNGGSQGDNCNCDGYLTSPYTISIGSASQRGEFPWYGEPCASTLAVTYSSGAYQDQMIATTDLNNECTIKHTGTSASAPLAAGIIALALQVNPDLTWRDVQHLIVWTSEFSPVSENPGWIKNGAGLWTNTRFGFGLMNALAFVENARNWTTVPKRNSCRVRLVPNYNVTFSYGHPVSVPIQANGCATLKDRVKYLEHVEMEVNINYTTRGSIQIHLSSPSGTKVELLGTRKLDNSTEGFKGWTFMSVMTWGEQAQGLWLLHVADNVGPEGNHGSLGEIMLTLHGTAEVPEHMLPGPRDYNHDYNRSPTQENAIDDNENFVDTSSGYYKTIDYYYDF